MWTESVRINVMIPKLTIIILLLSTLSQLGALKNAKEEEVAFKNVQNREELTQAVDIGEPENLNITTISPSALYASWDPPSGNELPDNYHVRWLSGDGSYFGDDVSSNTFYEITELRSCTKYDVEVFSVKDSAESIPAEGSGTTYLEVPPEPENLHLNLTESPTEIKVSWAKPDTNCPITHYNVSWESQPLWGNDESRRGWKVEDGSDSTESSINDAFAYSKTTVCVSAANEAGYGLDTCQQITTNQDEPSAPISVKATDGFGYSEVEWEPPEMENGIITNYKIMWNLNDTLEEEKEVGNVTYYKLPLATCTDYKISVSARNDAGLGPPSDHSDVFILNNETAKNVTCYNNDNTVSVQWETEKDCPVESYSVSWDYHIIWSDELGSDEMIINGTTKELELDGSFNTQYTICITTLIDDVETGESQCCDTETEEGVPGAPVLEQISSGETGAKIHLSWKPPEEQNGIISSYRITWKDSSNSFGTLSVPGTETEAEISLLPCETYEITLAANTSKGFGPESEPQNFLVENFVPANKVTCTFVGERSVVVSWSTAVTSCNDPGFHFAFNWTTLWSSPYQESNVEDLGPEKLEFTVSDIKPYSRLYSCVGVGNDIDVGACCTVDTQQEVPGPPEDLKITDTGESHVNITWEIPTEVNGELTEWQLSWISYETDENDSETLESDSRSYNIEGLTPGTEYIVMLQACTAAGAGSGANTTFITIDQEEAGPNLAAIIGGTVGGILALLLCAGIVFFVIRKKGDIGLSDKIRRKKRMPRAPNSKYDDVDFRSGSGQPTNDIGELSTRVRYPVEKVTQPPNLAPHPPKSAPQPPKFAPQPPKLAPKPPKFAPQPPKLAPKPPKFAPQPPKYAPQPPNLQSKLTSNSRSEISRASPQPDERLKEASIVRSDMNDRQRSPSTLKRNTTFAFGDFIQDRKTSINKNVEDNLGQGKPSKRYEEIPLGNRIATPRPEDPNQSRSKQSFLWGELLSENKNQGHINLEKSHDSIDL